jgi:hypothetical protein
MQDRRRGVAFECKKLRRNSIRRADIVRAFECDPTLFVVQQFGPQDLVRYFSRDFIDQKV